MKKKLTYTKIVNAALSIDLDNGFEVISVISTDNKVSFYLKSNNANVMIPIDELQEMEFEADAHRLNAEILKYVATLLRNGELNKYIENYNQQVIESFHEFHNTLKVGDK